MSSTTKWLNLQLFAGGAAAGAEGGDGAASGANPVDAGQARLRELGVPETKIRKNRAYKMPQAATKPELAKGTQQVAAAKSESTAEPEGTPDNTPARMTWEEIMADPEYNKQMQSVVQQRLKNAKASEEALQKLSPAIEVLARKYKLDTENMDYAALAKAVSDDDQYYEEKALEMGVSVESAKKLDQEQRANAREQRDQERTIEQQKIINHIRSLEQQGNELKRKFPTFDLREELKNPAFARMTSPNIGISVEDAYYAVHRNEIQTASMQIATQRAAEQIANSVRAGQSRPDENGTTSQGPSQTVFDYTKASKAERDRLKARIRAGERIRPGEEWK